MDKLNDSIILTGATGFLGRHVYRELEKRGYKRIIPVTFKGILPKYMLPSWTDGGPQFNLTQKHFIRVDLRDWSKVRRIFRGGTYDSIKGIKGIINLAAKVGGIGANQIHSAEFMMDSLLIGTNLIGGAIKNKSMQDGGKFVQIGTVCSYPKNAKVPFKESDIWNGYPEETNAAYGIAKKTLMELVIAYNKQYPDKFNGINLIPVNLYGPGDNFDLESSHVIPALIRKFDSAILNNESEVVLWGTGNASREFLYVGDAAEAIVTAFEKYEGSEPVNLGTGKEIKIVDLAEKIANMMGYQGTILFDPSKPDGQPRRCLDVSRALSNFGFQAKTDLDTGLQRTILDWQNRREYA